MKCGELIQLLAEGQRGVRALLNKRSHIWRVEGGEEEEREKKVGEEKSGIVGEGESSVLRGFTTWTMNTRNEPDHNHHPPPLVSFTLNDPSI